MTQPPRQQAVTSASAPASPFGRTLLRRLRDLNLQAERVGVDAGRVLRIAGCCSKDAPVESGVRYTLTERDRELVLELRWEDDHLEVRLDGASRQAAFGTAEDGRLEAQDLRARISTSPDAADLTRLMRRVVRFACAA